MLKVSPQGVERHTRVSREWATEVDDEDKENEDPGDEDQEEEDQDEEDQEDQEDEDQEDQDLEDQDQDPVEVCQQFSSKLQMKMQVGRQ